MLQVFRDTIIYVFCPSGAVSGGPEALHQLCYYLVKGGYNAKMVYMGGGTIPERYKEYQPQIIEEKRIQDNIHNIVIMPETFTRLLWNFKHCRKVVWWLSYDYYDGFTKKTIKTYLKNFVKRCLNLFLVSKKYILNAPAPKQLGNFYHLCGSKYVYLKLKKNPQINNLEMFVEPISLDFLRIGMAKDFTSANRTDIIPYNPAKPSDIMKRLLKRSDLQFIPIKGMNPRQIAELFRKTKLYIDFGPFPGPERIPKESVYNGTCLLVGKRNAAENDFDVAIPEEYKIEDYNNEELVVNKIKDILKNYDLRIKDFDFFREKIQKLEENFIDQIQSIFIKTL